MSKLRSAQMRPLSVAEAAYIAGIIDGEGTITISKKKGGKTTKRGYCFRPLVAVNMTNRVVIEWLSATTGLSAVIPKPRKPPWKPAWVWNVWSNQARQLLEAILPYLIVKKVQAELLLEFCRRKRDGVGRGGLTAEEWAFQEESHRQMGKLNKRGV